jgi:hypothetical protein
MTTTVMRSQSVTTTRDIADMRRLYRVPEGVEQEIKALTLTDVLMAVTVLRPQFLLDMRCAMDLVHVRQIVQMNTSCASVMASSISY